MIVCCHMYKLCSPAHSLIHRPNYISKLTPASGIWWFFTLLLISKNNAFLPNWEFWAKILIFENTLITTERQEIQTTYLKKYLGTYILWYHIIRTVWFILHETLFQKLNLTQKHGKAIYRKNRYMHGMLQQIRSIFWNYPYKIHMVS